MITDSQAKICRITDPIQNSFLTTINKSLKFNAYYLINKQGSNKSLSE
jgi:hypothetical protein